MNTCTEVVTQQWICLICDFIFDETLGMPDEGVPPGTRFEDIPESWVCPDCGVTKSDFELVQA
ncbi:rubredoxin [Sulfuriferula nivalis]|uniref:Rubredoxin n=1 Tax=Sulfuriferula nivalis TaxID=2675298 RepID=A0A809SAL0_9PROT|nr:Rubredoxin-2 [Sulfuriferula nivalis]